ncbi:hypothetical protein GCM10025789_20370 [Tessaracoccus lubricantis]|uniref:Type I-E CRISPR-associated protein Cse2/CasB n=1 Tax=Tessaracoccus lubricantis TaxID=545543 RepID=A0ABP9FHD3_9ACTN
MNGEKFDLARFVNSRIYRLVGSQPGQLSPTGRALLAQLRQAANAEPGTVPAVWTITTEGLPDYLGEVLYRRTETAVHVALTQFALHQQSRRSVMHSTRQRFGTAVRRLANKQAGHDQDPHETPVYRRFSAMLNSTTLPALLAHSRGIIPQLRDEEIPFDYGAYAQDIFWFLTPGRATEVRRRWGRDFHRNTADTADTEISTHDAEGAIQ